jgi:hypothetical protein
MPGNRALFDNSPSEKFYAIGLVGSIFLSIRTAVGKISWEQRIKVDVFVVGQSLSVPDW